MEEIFNTTFGNKTTPSTLMENTTTVASEEEVRYFLDILQRETTTTMIPAMIMLALFGVVGLIGNSLVLVVYSRKFQRTSTRIFIMAIAAFDLVTNIMVIPGEIYDMHHIWDFDNPPLCRGRLFFSAFTTVAAAVILLAVAVVRFRKVCRPFGRQVTVKEAKIISVAIAACSVVFALPTAIINGRQTKPTPWLGIHGYECTIDDSFVGTIWPLANTGFLLLLFISSCIPLIVLYILIGIQAWKHSVVYGVSSVGKSGADTSVSQSSTSGPFTKSTDDSVSTPETKRRKEERKTKSFNSATVGDDDDVDDKEGDNGSDIELKSVRFMGRSNNENGNNTGTSRATKGEAERHGLLIKIPRSSEGKPAEQKDTALPTDLNKETIEKAHLEKRYYRNSRKGKRNNSIKALRKGNDQADATRVTPPSSKRGRKRKALGRTTFMLIMISAVYFMGYVPHLAMMFFKFTSPEKFAAMGMVGLSFYNLFLRFYFLNSAANPVIYSLCDVNFRRHCLGLIRFRV